MNATSCPNLNHRRANAPVRYCPGCGEVVNSGVSLKRCDERGHAHRRLNGETFCVDCGEQLIKQ
jgi:hypothetical protein